MAALQILDPNHVDVVVLDVGGVCFRVSKATLARAPNNKILEYITYKNVRHVFIDADPKAFKPILNYLRTNIFLCNNSNEETMALFLADQLSIKIPKHTLYNRPHDVQENRFQPNPVNVNAVLPPTPQQSSGITSVFGSFFGSGKVEEPTPIPSPISQNKFDYSGQFYIHVQSKSGVADQISVLQPVLSQQIGFPLTLALHTPATTSAILYVMIPIVSRVSEAMKTIQFVQELKSVPEQAFIVVFGKVLNPNYSREICESVIEKRQIYIIYFEQHKLNPQPGVELLAKHIAIRLGIKS